MESKLFTPYKLGPVTLRNRTIRSAAFESMGKDFGPTQQLKDYHVAVARGGVGMTTLAYAAVCRSGLSFNKQLWLRPEIVPGLRDITDAIHREGAAAAIQIGHCGNMTHWTTAGQMPIGASSGVNLYAYTPVRGMRRSEICGLKWDNVDFQQDVLYICEARTAANGVAVDKGPKSVSSVRRLSFAGNEDLRELLRRMDSTNRSRRERLGEDYNPHGFVVTHGRGQPYAPDYLSGHFTKFVRQCQLPPCTLHGLRHSFASIANQQKVPM